MEKDKGQEKKAGCCEGQDRREAGKEGRRMKHGMGMMLCCLVPLAAIALVPMLGLRQGGTLTFLASLVCPIAMMVMMFSMSRMGRGGSCHGSGEREAGEV